MSQENFNPYYEWLGIAPEEQPANYYRLLGLRLFESSSSVIDTSADRQTSHIRTFQTGPRAAYAQHLLNDIAQARITLVDPVKKAAYDYQLQAFISATWPIGPPYVEQPIPVSEPFQAKPKEVKQKKHGLNPVIEFVKIAVGGVIGVFLAVLVLSYFAGIDVLGWQKKLTAKGQMQPKIETTMKEQTVRQNPLPSGADVLPVSEAKSYYLAEKENLKTELMIKFDEAIAASAAKGNLESVLTLKKERECFEVWNILPASSQMKILAKTYSQREQEAKSVVVAAYNRTIQEHTKNLKLDHAKTLRDESLQFSHPFDATEFRGHWYKRFPGPITWYDAHKKCERMGGHLPFIETMEENKFVTGFVPYWKSTWFGGIQVTGKWRWTNGQPFTFTNWSPGEPNNKNDSEECLQLWIKGPWDAKVTGTWNDSCGTDGVPASVYQISGFICEWDE